MIIALAIMVVYFVGITVLGILMYNMITKLYKPIIGAVLFFVIGVVYVGGIYDFGVLETLMGQLETISEQGVQGVELLVPTWHGYYLIFLPYFIILTTILFVYVVMVLDNLYDGKKERKRKKVREEYTTNE